MYKYITCTYQHIHVQVQCSDVHVHTIVYHLQVLIVQQLHDNKQTIKQAATMASLSPATKGLENIRAAT